MERSPQPPGESRKPPCSPRKPYAPPSILHADEIHFETQLVCTFIKTMGCVADVGCTTASTS
jgi:hypothetical protein